MGSKTLSIPDVYVQEVIQVIRTGLKNCPETDGVVEHALNKWCKQHQYSVPVPKRKSMHDAMEEDPGEDKNPAL